MENIERANRKLTERKRMAYLPFAGGAGGPRIGLRALGEREWFEFDEDYDHQVALRRALLERDPRSCVLHEEGPRTEWVSSQISDFVHEHVGGNPKHGFVDLVQDDLCICERWGDDYRLTSASVCFPTGWSLKEKMGKPVTEIHDGVGTHAFRRILVEAMKALPENETVWRLNWFIYGDSGLWHPQDNPLLEHSDRLGITDENAGDKLFIRYERQTLRKFPGDSILFTIRVYVDPLRTLKEQHPEGVRDFVKAYLKHVAAKRSSLLPYELSMLSYLGEGP